MPTDIAAEAKCDETLNLRSHMRPAVATNAPSVKNSIVCANCLKPMPNPIGCMTTAPGTNLIN